MNNISHPSPAVLIKDEQSLENIQLEDCLFLLKIGIGTLQYAIYKRDTRYFIRLASYHFKENADDLMLKAILQQITNENKTGFPHFKKVKIIFNTPLFTLIPDSFYKESLKEDYFSFLYPEKEQHEIQTEAIAGLSVHNVYAVHKKLWNGIKNTFPDADITHCSTLLLKQIMNSSDSANTAFILVHSDSVILTVFSEGKLLMMQPFEIKTPLDAVYHLLNGLRQQALHLKDLSVFISGEGSASDEIFEKLKTELPNIKWLNRPEGFQYPTSISQHPEHYFYQLASLVL